ncbi:MAG: TonB-dependent receptor [Candidatus Eisenbacteria bacterium]
MIRSLTRSLVVLLVFGGVSLSGAETGGEEDLLFGEGERVITPARHSLTVSDAPASVTVITEEDIASSGAQTITDLLREVPGLEVFAVSPTDVNVGVRGYNGTLANKMLVMIDGRSVYEDFFGFVVWQTIPVSLEEIKQIEVVRGPGSAVYGANAYGGIIHIITKSPRELAGTSVLLQHGVEGGQEEVAVTRAGGAPGGTDFKSFLSWRRSGTHGIEESGDSPEGVRGSFTLARPVGRRSQFSLSGGFDDGEGVALNGLGVFDYQNQHVYGSAGFENPEFRGHLYWNRNRHDTYADVIADPNHEPEFRDIQADLVNLDLQWMRRGWSDVYWVAGANARYLVFESGFTEGKKDQELAGLYGQAERTFRERSDVTVGLRADHHPETGISLSPRASLVHRFEGRRYIRFSVGQAYRSPTLIENYLFVENVTVVEGEGIPTANAVGNPDLKTERVLSYEMTYGVPLGHRAFLRLEGFRNENRDWILWKPTSYYSEAEVGPYLGGVLPKTLGYENVYDVTSHGAEVALDFRWNPDWETRVGYSYVDYENRDEIPPEFVFMPEHKVSVQVTGRPARSLRTTAAAHYRTEARFGDDAEPIPEQVTMDGAIRYDFLYSRISTELAVQNLFDSRYEEHPEGETFGRRVYARLHYRF